MRIKRRIARSAANVLSVAMRAGGRPFYRYMLDSLWERQPFFEASTAQEPLDIELFYRGYVDPDPGDSELVERIFAAYRKAKAAQREADPVFLPSSAWRTVLDRAFAPLSEGLAKDDLGRFHHFLANFRSWEQSTGMEPSEQIREYARDRVKREHFERRVVAPILRWWQRSESHGRDLSALTIPPHGNMCGVMVDGHLIAPSSIFCDFYGRLLAGFVPGERPVVAELGAGFGKLLYFISRHLDRACFIDVDLPESLACAAFFLVKSFPEQRFLLYGEGDLTAESLEEYDFVLLPSFEISRIPDRSVDLFINENSLGVMHASACQRFVREICRSANGFYHRNAESSRLSLDDGTQTLVNREFPIDEAQFEEVARYCDVSRMMSSGRLNFDMDMYWYYYQRRDVRSSTVVRRSADPSAA
jgi:hypothetical protein